MTRTGKMYYKGRFVDGSHCIPMMAILRNSNLSTYEAQPASAVQCSLKGRVDFGESHSFLVHIGRV